MSNSIIDKAKNLLATNPDNTLNQFNNEALLKKVEKLYIAAKKWITEKNIQEFSTTDVMQLVPVLMELIQDIEKREKNKDKNRGEYKKQIVILVVKLILKDYNVPMPPGMEGMSQEFINIFIIDHLLPGTINTIIDVAKGNVNLQKIGKRVGGCVKYCIK